MKKAVILPEDRIPNKVDLLLSQVKNIQEICEHDFRLVEEPMLIESLVKGVYVGSASGFIVREDEVIRRNLPVVRFPLVCLHCSKREETTILQVCLRCLGKMRKEYIDNDRTRYFGTEHTYDSVRLYRCPNCGFTVACDEWNY